jgi:uncharacterized protein DUF955
VFGGCIDVDDGRWELVSRKGKLVERFTLAHELCHLLLDREWGRRLPWRAAHGRRWLSSSARTPLRPAFLMPSWLLCEAIALLARPVAEPGSMLILANRLRVSTSSLVDRLYNLGEITEEGRIRLRAPEVNDT